MVTVKITLLKLTSACSPFVLCCPLCIHLLFMLYTSQTWENLTFQICFKYTVDCCCLCRIYHPVYCILIIYHWHIHWAPVCSITLIFLFLYDLISECWQEPNGKASDESARLQFWELEVRITLRGGGRQGRRENTSRKEDKEWGIPLLITLNSERESFCLMLPKSLGIVGMQRDFLKHRINCLLWNVWHQDDY